MAAPTDTTSMALFCDFENVALGVRDANYEKFDIKRVLERLLLKGSIVVKKAYCDWDRYKQFKATMHEANFELIEIPHVRQSGKNSADIRLVVDALDLCYTKSHVNTFVIISGDSDFSPLVSKLRENAKQVIGVGVKQSTSDLLIANCDEFIFYDDLVREGQRAAARQRAARRQRPAARPATTSPGARTNSERAAQPRDRDGGGDVRGADVRARRQRQDPRVGAEGRHQAPQARLQRVALRLPHLRQPARGGAGARAAGGGARRERQRLRAARRGDRAAGARAGAGRAPRRPCQRRPSRSRRPPSRPPSRSLPRRRRPPPSGAGPARPRRPRRRKASRLPQSAPPAARRGRKPVADAPEPA